MLIVAVYGSPREGGNTDILMEAFLKPIEEKEEIRRFYLRNLVLKPCISCGGCDRTGICVFKDDIWNVYESIEQARAFIVSSPIYFASVSAQLKILIDRAQSFWVRKYVLGYENSSVLRKGFFISVGAVNTDKHFKNAKFVVQSHMNTLNIKYSGELFFPGVERKGEIKNMSGAINKATQSGEQFI